MNSIRRSHFWQEITKGSQAEGSYRTEWLKADFFKQNSSVKPKWITEKLGKMKEVEVRLPGDDAELKCIADIGVGGSEGWCFHSIPSALANRQHSIRMRLRW